MNNNNPPTGTMTLAQIEIAARDIRHTFRGMKSMPSLEQMINAVENYCDDPNINRTDRARIRVRLEQIL